MPQAFICNNDEVAYRMIRTLKGAGYDVPKQVAIVGYDDYAGQEKAELALTTYHVNVDEMIRICIQIVEERMTDPEYRSGTVTVNGCLVEGESA